MKFLLPRIEATDLVHVVQPADVPNANWLTPAQPSAGAQACGRDLLTAHPFVAIPSAVNPHGWNLLFNPAHAAGRYTLVSQTRFALSTLD